MKNLKVFIALAIAATVVTAARNVFEYEIEKLLKNEEVENEIQSLWKGTKRPVKIDNFDWKDCGGNDSLATIKSFDIHSPVLLPGTLTVSVSVEVRKTLANLDGDVTIFRKTEGVYIRVPCIAGLGSCHYEDVCSLLKQIPQCPEALEKAHLDCKCPVKQNTYNVTNAVFEIDATAFQGDFHFIGKLTTKNSETAACVDFYLTFE